MGGVTDPTWHPPTSSPGAPRYGEYAPTGTPGSSPVPPAGPPAPGNFPPAGAWTPPPKPGLIPLRPLSFGTLLGAPFQVLRRNPKATFGSALIVQGASLLISLLVIGLVSFFALGRVADAPVGEQDAVEAGAILTIVLSALIPLGFTVLASALLQGVIVQEVARATLGEKLRLGALWRMVGRRLWPLALWTLALSAVLLVAIALITGLVVLCVIAGGAWLAVGIILGVLGGLGLVALFAWLFTRTAIVPSLIVIEKLSVGRAIRRSWSLTTGYFWRTMGVLFLIMLIVNIVAQIVTFPLSMLFSVALSLVDPNAAFDAYIPSIVLYVLTLLIALVIGAVAAVAQSAAVALIYIDLRMRKEGLDLELQRFVEATPGTGPADPYLTGPAAAAADPGTVAPGA